MNKTVRTYIETIAPPEESPSLDAVSRLVRLAPEFPELAADTILNPKLCGKLVGTIQEALEALSKGFGGMSPQRRKGSCRAFLEVAFNLMGVESEMTGFSESEREEAEKEIVEALKGWQADDGGKAALKEAISGILDEMEKTMMGNSMNARMAENIGQKLNQGNLVESFVKAVKEEIRGNIYYLMTKKKMTKLGNDSATGLRRVRHLGFVQVSSNPVIAARAYYEFPELWDKFKRIVKENPQWKGQPEKYADNITLHGTMTSLLPNLIIFRPIALLSGLHDGLVSYQLNPFNAEGLKENLRDAEEICQILSEILRHYDGWLGWDADKLKGRPNIVFKVAAYGPSAIDITVGLNEKGIGTNNTVTYTVSQELRLLLAEAEGMCKAMKKGILPTQVYQTNMEGRLEDHLRETEAERLVSRLSDEQFERLASKMCPESKGNREERTKVMCAKKNLDSLTNESFLEAIANAFGDENKQYLRRLEEAIRYSGVYVTREVYKLFFGVENQGKWRNYFKRGFVLSDKQVNTVLDRMDMLPASKRRADDTYFVLGMPNNTNTEFPNQQLAVWEKSRQRGFDLEQFRDSILWDADQDVLKRALEIEDFRKAYEITPTLVRVLNEAGIEDGLHGEGLEPVEWMRFGPVIKTISEFRNAYAAFRQKALEFVVKGGEKNT